MVLFEKVLSLLAKSQFNLSEVELGLGEFEEMVGESKKADLIIESQNIYFGKRAKQEHDNKTSEEKTKVIKKHQQQKTIIRRCIKCIS